MVTMSEMNVGLLAAFWNEHRKVNSVPKRTSDGYRVWNERQMVSGHL